MVHSHGAAAALVILGAVACRGGNGAQASAGGVRTAGGMMMFVDDQNSQPALRIVVPGRDSADRSIWVLFPEHVTAVAAGSDTAVHLYLFRAGADGERPAWRRTGNALEYERDLPGPVHLLARATLEEDGVRIRYEFTTTGTLAYPKIFAVTDPRLTGPFHDERLERTYVHHAGGFELLASETPARLTMPLDQWLPARYLASYTWPVPAERVQRRSDGITYYYKSRAVDAPFIATRSQDGAWMIASFTRTTGNVWSNPELTCQHVDPETSLVPGRTAVEEMKLLVSRGTLDSAFALARRQRDSLK